MNKRLILLGLACTAMLIPAVSQANAQNNPIYATVQYVDASVAALASSITDQSKTIAQLNAKIAAQNEMIAALDLRISKLESGGLTPSPSASPSPTPTPASTPSPTPTTTGTGGYPAIWALAPQDTLVDAWGYYNRECVSYVAWKRSSVNAPLPYGWGNANQWPDNARAAGYLVDSTPSVGAVGVSMAGPYGFVGYVEAVNGSAVTMSDYNVDNMGNYGVQTWNASSLIYIHAPGTANTVY